MWEVDGAVGGQVGIESKCSVLADRECIRLVYDLICGSQLRTTT